MAPCPDLKTIIIDWHGPFKSIDEIKDEKWHNSLYFLFGKLKSQKQAQIQYIGITERKISSRFKDKSHKYQELREESRSIWIGEIHYPKKFNRSFLELAEHCLIFIYEPELNKVKKNCNPKYPICLISQWCKADGEPRKRHPSMIKDFYDIYWWDNIRWRIGGLKIFKDS